MGIEHTCLLCGTGGDGNYCECFFLPRQRKKVFKKGKARTIFAYTIIEDNTVTELRLPKDFIDWLSTLDCNWKIKK